MLNFLLVKISARLVKKERKGVGYVATCSLFNGTENDDNVSVLKFGYSGIHFKYTVFSW